MRIGIFWNNIPSNEFKLAKSIIECQRADFSAYFQDVLSAELHIPSVREVFAVAFEFAKKNNVQFVILCNRPAWILDPSKLYALVSEPAVQEKAISVRAGKIDGKGFNFSPKFPYMDADFIIFNVVRCEAVGVMDALHTATGASHFTSWGGIHAELLSVLEAMVPYGELYVYSDGSDCQNIYGEFRNFVSSSYLYSDKYGFLSADPEQDDRVHALRAELLAHHHISGTRVVDEYIQRYQRTGRFTVDSSGMPFSRVSMFKLIGDTLRIRAKQLTRGINYEIQKKYDNP